VRNDCCLSETLCSQYQLPDSATNYVIASRAYLASDFFADNVDDLMPIGALVSELWHGGQFLSVVDQSSSLFVGKEEEEEGK